MSSNIKKTIRSLEYMLQDEERIANSLKELEDYHQCIAGVREALTDMGIETVMSHRTMEDIPVAEASLSLLTQRYCSERVGEVKAMKDLAMLVTPSYMEQS